MGDDMSEHPKITSVKLYIDGAGEYRFTSYAANGEAIVVSSEGYTDRDNAIGAIQGVHGDDISIVEDPQA
jgi:uncharacterized protein YegP (UPF0339 family)